MEVLLSLPLLMIPLFFPLIAGLMAQSFGRNFWLWFFVGIALPFVANIILLCLPSRKKIIVENSVQPAPGTSDEFDNYLAEESISDKQDQHEAHFPASA